MPVYTSSIEVTADYPTIKPSLNLNFARSRSLDPRITFTRASTATYIGRDGLVKYAGVDEPRFDHDPDTLESLGLLIEESRTNIALYSQEFNNVYWSKTGGGNPGTTVTANQAVAPDGTNTADFIDYTTAIFNSQNIERSYDATPDGKTYTASVWIKGTSGQTINLTLDASGVNGSAEQFTLNGNWQRFSITRTYPAGSPDALFRFGTRNLNHPSAGTATQIYAWGAQIELGSFPTSYIPTSGAAVTRARDDASITGESFSSWYNDTEGTIVSTVKIDANRSYTGTFRHMYQFTFSSGNSNDRIGFIISSSNNPSSDITNSSSGIFQTNEPNYTNIGDPVTVALAVKTDDFAYSVNGLTPRIDNLGNLPPMNFLYIGRVRDNNQLGSINGTISKLVYYPKRLTNAQLQLLTS